jgi:hypothetical protein
MEFDPAPVTIFPNWESNAIRAFEKSGSAVISRSRVPTMAGSSPAPTESTAFGHHCKEIVFMPAAPETVGTRTGVGE